MINRYSSGARRVGVVALAVSGVFALGAGSAHAKGGTAKPPQGSTAPWVVSTLPTPSGFGTPAGSVPAADLHGFDDTGYLEHATVDAPSASCSNPGGTAVINGQTITIPCNMIVQMPANTLTWSDVVNGASVIDGFVTGKLLNAVGGGALEYAPYEFNAIGNIVGDKQIAGLIYMSQQSLNSGTGTIKSIDYANESLTLTSGTVLKINDPKGRFGAGSQVDARFSVDDANPTIHAGTGYPMCIPRTDPTAQDDPLCPQQNRPNRVSVTVGGAAVTATTCRNFSQAGVVPPAGSGELTPPPAGQKYCSQYVMAAPPADATTAMPLNGSHVQPDARQQAPFEVGDFISYSGTLMQDSTGNDFVSAHTIEANLGIYTQPGKQPSYVAIGEFGVGSADPAATAVNGAAQESQDRIFLEAETTDFKTPVDIYYEDVDPATGTTVNRWVTPAEMTGEAATTQWPQGGGITTANTGAQPQRDRLRATKAPIGLLSQPTRTVRVVARSLCVPNAPSLDANGNPNFAPTSVDNCLSTAAQSANLRANGLMPGQYTAPTFEFIFPENVRPGDAPVPNDLWHLPFIANGEGNGIGAESPSPW